MHESAIDEILQFWFEEIEHARWFRKDPDFDREIEARFGKLLTLARQDELDDWCSTPRGCLAFIILNDQFPRNIHRDTPAAFEADPKALAATLRGIEQGLDEDLTPEERSFFYLPLRHAEDLEMQQLGLKKTREINRLGYGTDKYALSHLELIQMFGRFPHRNKILGRPNTPEEEKYLAQDDAGF